MLVSQALQLVIALLAQILPAVAKGQETIEVEQLGEEHREALTALQAYLASLPPPPDAPPPA